jgi:hypothetical protein
MAREEGRSLYQSYDEIIRTLVGMINHPAIWVIGGEDRMLREESADYDEPF